MLKGLSFQSHQFNSNTQPKIKTIAFKRNHKDILLSSLSFYKSILHPYKHSNYFTFLNKNNSSYEKESKSVCDFKTEFSHWISAKPSIQRQVNEEDTEKHFYKENHNSLIQQIIKARKESAIRISSFLKKQHTLIRVKRNRIIQSIINLRTKLIIKIQAAYRCFLIRNQMKALLDYDYILFYTLMKENTSDILISEVKHKSISLIQNKNDNQDLRLFIYGDHNKKRERTFIYSKLFKQWYIPFMKRGVIKQRYKVNFVLNGHIIVDSRYDIDNDTKGNFYNILSKTILYKKAHNKQGKEEFFYRKYMDLFKMKAYKKHSNSWDSLSISNASINNDQFNDCIPKYSFNLTMNAIKPILKNTNDQLIEMCSKRRSSNVIHKVSFNQRVEYSY